MLCLFALSACAGRQVKDSPAKPIQPPPAEVMQPLPAPGYFRQKLDDILKRGQTLDPTSTP